MTITPTTLAIVEDFMVSALSTAFGATVLEVAAVPAKIDEAELTRILHQAPALYVAFLGGSRSEIAGLTLHTHWGVYVVAANAGGETARRRGDGITIGAYDMIARAAAALERVVVPGVGTLALENVEHLPAAAFEKNGKTVFGIVFSLPLSLPYGADALAPLPPFQTFEATWDLDTVTAATDTVLLPGATS